MESVVLDELDAAIEAFAVPLRMGEGFSEEKFERLCAALRSCAENWASSDLVPKRAAIELFGLSSSIEACSNLYSGSVKERAREAASIIYNLTLDVFKTR